MTHTSRKRLRYIVVALVGGGVATVLLTGCVQLQSPYCDEFGAAWQHFADVRDNHADNPLAVIEASHELRARWATLHAGGDAPEDVIDMMENLDHSFVSAWNASSRADRNDYQRSWRNARDYIARRCSEIGVDLEFTGGDVPIESPQVSDAG